LAGEFACTDIVLRKSLVIAPAAIAPAADSSADEPSLQHVYPIHFRCITIVDRVIGLTLAWEHPRLFLGVTLDNDWLLKRSVRRQMIEHAGVLMNDGNLRWELERGNSKRRRIALEAAMWTDEEMKYPGVRYPALDPVSILH
jgi:hypothetical protein